MSKIIELSLLLFAFFVSTGGLIGFLKAKSKASLWAGIISGTLLLCSYSISLRNSKTGFLLGAILTGLLILIFTIRFIKTKKFMPAGMLLIFSICEEILLITGITMPLQI